MAVSGYRNVVCGSEPEQLSRPRLPKLDGLVRLHRGPASFRLSRRAIGETPPRPQRSPRRGSPYRTREAGPMKAMILAAGLGTRLRPLTDDRPKALVEVGGRTLLQIALARLSSFGIREVIINVHHFADKIVDYLLANHNFGIDIAISREDVLLDTVGRLKKAPYFFLRNSASAEDPFVLHNVVVINIVGLRRRSQFHVENCALATLAVQGRRSTRVV